MFFLCIFIDGSHKSDNTTSAPLRLCYELSNSPDWSTWKKGKSSSVFWSVRNCSRAVIFFFFIHKKVYGKQLLHMKLYFINYSHYERYIILKNQKNSYCPFMKYFSFFVFGCFFYAFLWMVIMTVMSIKFSCAWIFFFIFIQNVFFYWCYK